MRKKTVFLILVTTAAAVKTATKVPLPSWTGFSVKMSTVAPTRRSTRDRYKEKMPRTVPKKTQGPLEYLMDQSASRDDDDPFHILLLGDTFEKPRITVSYVIAQLCYTLEMPEPDAQEHAVFASEHGMSCLGTWSRKDCLDLGEKLQLRDVVCRVVPFSEGGQRSWQARNIS